MDGRETVGNKVGRAPAGRSDTGMTTGWTEGKPREIAWGVLRWEGAIWWCVMGSAESLVCMQGSLYVCLRVCMCLCRYVCRSVCLSACQSVCMYVCTYVCLSVCLSDCLYVCIYVCIDVM